MSYEIFLRNDHAPSVVLFRILMVLFRYNVGALKLYGFFMVRCLLYYIINEGSANFLVRSGEKSWTPVAHLTNLVYSSYDWPYIVPNTHYHYVLHAYIWNPQMYEYGTWCLVFRVGVAFW